MEHAQLEQPRSAGDSPQRFDSPRIVLLPAATDPGVGQSIKISPKASPSRKLSALSMAVQGLVLPPQASKLDDDQESSGSGSSSSSGGLIVSTTPAAVWDHVKSLSDDLERKKESINQLQSALEAAQNKLLEKDADISTLRMQAQATETELSRRLASLERENQELKARLESERASVEAPQSESPSRRSRVPSLAASCGVSSKARLSALDLPSHPNEIYSFLDRFDTHGDQPVEREPAVRGVPGANGLDCEDSSVHAGASVHSVSSVNEEGSGRFTMVISKVKQELFGALERLESMRTRSSKSDKLKRLEEANKELTAQLAERDEAITVLRRKLQDGGQGRFGSNYGSSGDLGAMAGGPCRGASASLSSPCAAVLSRAKLGGGIYELTRANSDGHFGNGLSIARQHSPFGP